MNIETNTLASLEWAIATTQIKKADMRISTRLYSLILLYRNMNGTKEFLTEDEFNKLRKKVEKYQQIYGFYL